MLKGKWVWRDKADICEALLLPRPGTVAVSSSSSYSQASDIRYMCQRIEVMQWAAQQVHPAKIRRDASSLATGVGLHTSGDGLGQPAWHLHVGLLL